MKVLNVHNRTINQPLEVLSKLLETLSTNNDQVWPLENWPAMRFKEGIQVGAKGGHGPIRYIVEKYNTNKIIQFRFSRPIGFDGIHKLELSALDKEHTEIKHTIHMQTRGILATLKWILAVQPLHDALIEDAFDNLQNKLMNESKSSKWSLWVILLRKILARTKI